MTAPDTAEGRWAAMGADVHVIVLAEQVAPAELVSQAQARIFELEALWSRFRPDSEISRLNTRCGIPMRCEPETVRLVTEMVRGWWITDGCFDPTLLAPLIGAGYAESRTDRQAGTALRAEWATRGCPAEILVDHNTVQLPFGTALDPGGLGKGLAADIVVEHLRNRGADGVLVSIGGDVAVWGTPPRRHEMRNDAAWRVDVEPHLNAGDDLVRLMRGGVATSSAKKRRWHADGEERHHIIDPVTGSSTDVGVCGATVVAGSAVVAEVLTKLPFVAGVSAALARYDEIGVAAKVWHDTGTFESSAWSEYSAQSLSGSSRPSTSQASTSQSSTRPSSETTTKKTKAKKTMAKKLIEVPS